MKDGIHPDYHPVVFVDGEHEIITRSTVTSPETRDIDGVSHYVVTVDVTSYSHPFYTGKQKLMDTEGRIERFNRRYQKTQAAQAAAKKGEAETAEKAESTEKTE